MMERLGLVICSDHFEGDDVGGLVRVIINARAKGDVGVSAAIAG